VTRCSTKLGQPLASPGEQSREREKPSCVALPSVEQYKAVSISLRSLWQVLTAIFGVMSLVKLTLQT